MRVLKKILEFCFFTVVLIYFFVINRSSIENRLMPFLIDHFQRLVEIVENLTPYSDILNTVFSGVGVAVVVLFIQHRWNKSKSKKSEQEIQELRSEIVKLQRKEPLIPKGISALSTEVLELPKIPDILGDGLWLHILSHSEYPIVKAKSGKWVKRRQVLYSFKIKNRSWFLPTLSNTDPVIVNVVSPINGIFFVGDPFIEDNPMAIWRPVGEPEPLRTSIIYQDLYQYLKNNMHYIFLGHSDLRNRESCKPSRLNATLEQLIKGKYNTVDLWEKYAGRVEGISAKDPEIRDYLPKKPVKDDFQSNQ